MKRGKRGELHESTPSCVCVWRGNGVVVCGACSCHQTSRFSFCAQAQNATVAGCPQLKEDAIFYNFCSDAGEPV